MRAELTRALPDVCTLRRYAVVADGQGGQTRTWSDLAESFCRLIPFPQRAIEQTAEGRLTEDTNWLLLLPYGTTARREDRVRVNGVDYELTAQEDGATEPLCTAFMVRRVV